jgi:hypothetical protein
MKCHTPVSDEQLVAYGYTCFAAVVFYFVMLAIVCFKGYQFLIARQNYKVFLSLIFYVLALLQTLCRIA